MKLNFTSMQSSILSTGRLIQSVFGNNTTPHFTEDRNLWLTRHIVKYGRIQSCCFANRFSSTDARRTHPWVSCVDSSSCVIPHVVPRSLLNQNVIHSGWWQQSHFHSSRPPSIHSLSHDYVPSKRYCSFCLFRKHVSREATLLADKDPLSLHHLSSHRTELKRSTAPTSAALFNSEK